MSDLQKILVTLASIAQQTLVNQRLLWDILAKEVDTISPESREMIAKIQKDDMERYKLLGEIGRLIAHVE